MKKFQILLLIFFFLNLTSFSQTQPPPFLKWQKITTPHFKIVFPEGLESEALETASLMDYMFEKVPDVYKIKTKKINLYLNNQTTIPNGFVTLAPRYMEWYLNAPQDASFGGTDWKRTLAVHEYRHVVQFDKFNQNVTRIFSVIFGDIGTGLLLNWSVPAWYMEGDAVSAETVLTNSGRGRLPQFEMETKAIFTGTNRKVKYDQAYLGSYKNYFPNHYHLGYLMHTHVARNYSMYTWSRVMNRVNKLPYLPFSFSSSLKKYTGYNLKKTYRNTFEELKENWETFPLPGNITPVMVQKHKVRTNYRYAGFLYDNSILSLKYGMADPPQLVQIKPGGKEKTMAFLNSVAFISFNEMKAVWDTYTPSIRWGERDFSDIVVYDFKKDKKRKITHRKKYVSPSISPSGKEIAAVRYGKNQDYHIDILNAENGKVIKQFDFGKTYVRTPSWSPDEKYIVFTTSSEDSVTLSLLNVETRKVSKLIISDAENMTKPVFWNDYVLFNSPATGKDDIHAIQIQSGKRYVALSGGYGFSNPSTSNGRDEILVETYIPDEYALYKWVPDENKFVPFNASMTNDSFYITPVIEKGGYSNIFRDYVRDTIRKIEKYHHFTDGLKIHSWIPNLTTHIVGGEVYASDPLSQISLVGSFEYNINESNTLQGISIRYSGLFPVFDLGLSSGHRNASYLDETNDSVEYYQWGEDKFTFSATLPFSFIKGAFNQNIEASAGYSYIFNKNIDRIEGEFDFGNGELSTINTSLIYLGYRQLSMRDFYPKFGALFMAGYSSTLSKSDWNGSILSLSLTGFLPGLMKHHSLRINTVIENQSPSNINSYVFLSNMLYFRGYSHIFYENFQKLSFDYSLPVLYPEISLGSVLYIKRIRTNLFTDIGKGKFNSFTKDFFSYGADILFDCNFFRLLTTIDLGPRFSFTNEGNFSVEFVALQALNL